VCTLKKKLGTTLQKEMPLSRTGSDLVLVVTPDDATKPFCDWMNDGTVVYANARDKGVWPALTQLDVPLVDLPRAYVLRDTPVDWLDRPCRLPTTRVSVVPLDGCNTPHDHASTA
jgi:hypothetical protein